MSEESKNPFEETLKKPESKEEGKIDLSIFPIPEDNAKFKDVSTDEIFSILMNRIKKDKAKAILANAYTQFKEISIRVNPNFAVSVAVKALQELGDGGVKAAHAIENQDGSAVGN